MRILFVVIIIIKMIIMMISGRKNAQSRFIKINLVYALSVFH